ncbi:GNAT family N-acetyltransferase [Bacillus sp. AK128]
MLEVKPIHKEDLELVAKFISELNNCETSHIGYCGKVSNEIAYALVNDLTDIPFTDSFFAAYDDNQLVGILGFDASLEDHIAEVWGPFLKEDYLDSATLLWNEMNKTIRPDIHTLHMFPNKKNSPAIKLAKSLNFTEHSEQTILSSFRGDFSKLEHSESVELTQNYFAEMIQLHDHAFPGTYYSGEQIVGRLNNERKVFVLTSGEGLLGYIYVEAEPEFGEGSIEFFAVKESEQGKGLGGHLLKIGLNWLFTFKMIDNITLCVNSTNKQAVSLYKKVGFKVIHELRYFTKNVLE